MQPLRTSVQSKQRQIVATRHLWESYFDDYRDFIMYMQTVVLWRRPLDSVALYLSIHFILWCVSFLLSLSLPVVRNDLFRIIHA
jgi:hypothetical protein